MESTSFKEFLKIAPLTTKLKIVALFFSGFLILVVTVFSIKNIWSYYQGPDLTESVLHRSRDVASISPEYTHVYEIKDMSVAFMNKKGTRTAYSQFTLIFDCENEECKKNMALQRAKVLDTIFEVGGEFYLEDFSPPLAPGGFAKFKSEIIVSLKKHFKSLAPREVVLKDWFLN